MRFAKANCYKSLLPLSCPKLDKRPRKGRKTGKTRKDQGSRLHMKVSKMGEMDRRHLRQRTATGLLMLVRFYFHDVEEQLKTTVHTNFCLKWILGFVIDCLNISVSFSVTQHLHFHIIMLNLLLLLIIYINTSVLLEHTPLVKLVQNHLWDSRGISSISS